MKTFIFVFGSNEAGRHGKGAALYARNNYKAICGQSYGLQGQSFAIPTKDKNLNTLPLWKIETYIKTFIKFAIEHPEYKFYLTRIGCGLAGYTDKDIAPMFKDTPPNIIKPFNW